MTDHIWRGGPRSSKSYKMDYYRQSSEPHEAGKKGAHGVTSVRPHYRTSKRGRSTTVNSHKRRY